jgi:hypothetical protein
MGSEKPNGRGPEYALRLGAAPDEIVRYALARDIDLIVMGTHGRSGVPHLVMGSVAEKVVRVAPCPVVTVRQPRQATSGGADAAAAPDETRTGAAGSAGMLHKIGRLRGTEVHASDGYVGRVEDFYFDDAGWKIRYVVINTKSWIGRHPVLISTEAVKPDWGRAGFQLTLTREQVRTSPEIDLQRTLSSKDEERVLGHFGHPVSWKANGQSGSTAHLCSTKEVIGAHIEASDGQIGHLDDFLIDEGSWHVQYLVLDTSNWIGGKWVLVGPKTLKGIDWFNSTLRVGLTREAVKRSPSIESVSITPGEDGPPFVIM